jgi:hypothetical protein
MPAWTTSQLAAVSVWRSKVKCRTVGSLVAEKGLRYRLSPSCWRMHTDPAASPSLALEESVLDHPLRSLMATAAESPLAISDNDSQQNLDSPVSYFGTVRSQKPLAFPDPSQFPDPYPFRPPHHHLVSTTPVLSSGESSTASTRSSAYTTSSGALASGDYGSEVYVAGEEDVQVGVGITSDDIVQLLTRDGDTSLLPVASRMPIDPLRWSEGYSLRRSHPNPHDMAVMNGIHENDAPNVSPEASFEAAWSSPDDLNERSTVSDEETDEGQFLEDIERGDTEHPHRFQERTTAMVIAEEGRGIIVRGEGVPLVQLAIRPGMYSSFFFPDRSECDRVRF